MEVRKLLLPALAVAAYFIYTQKKAIGLLSYYIRDVGLQFQGLTPVLRLNIAIQNPSNASFTINDFLGNITANDQDIGTISSFVKMDVPAASVIIYPVDVRMNLIGIVSDVVNLIQGSGGISQVIKLTGFVNASGVVAPVALTYKIG